jgi:uncharacterized membrane protein YeaQ/YmgE (transglycosylase-associated protein family)
LVIRKVRILEMNDYAGFGVSYNPYIGLVGADVGGFFLALFFNQKKTQPPVLSKKVSSKDAQR